MDAGHLGFSPQFVFYYGLDSLWQATRQRRGCNLVACPSGVDPERFNSSALVRREISVREMLGTVLEAISPFSAKIIIIK